jgi:hypothetical protein
MKDKIINFFKLNFNPYKFATIFIVFLILTNLAIVKQRNKDKLIVDYISQNNCVIINYDQQKPIFKCRGDENVYMYSNLPTTSKEQK